ncbi:MAG: hypothetical protein M3Y59_06350 [Myxococcota bacterium]|nr:hypothetical protein [Myxococcota bacterium]
MQRWIIVLALLASHTAMATELSPELLQRLGEWAKRTAPESAIASMKIRTVSEELDGNGRVQHTEEVVVRVLREGGSDLPRTEVISATRDGKDNREEVEKKQKKEKGKKSQRGNLSAALPFSLEQQPKYTFTLLDPYPDDPGMLRVGFGPKGKKEPEVFVGEAKVDPALGAVVWLKQQPSTMPMMVDNIDMSMHFGATSAQGPLLSEMYLRGKAGLPLMKKRFRAKMQFSEFQIKPAAP